MRRFLFLAFSVLAVISSALAQSPDKARLDSLLNLLTANHKLMGFVQVSQHGLPLYAKGFGEARPGIANSAQTVFRIGSISKVFTATMIFKQIDAGKLRLDDRLGKWFPKVPNAASITIDELLSHRSGLHNITEDSSFLTWQDTVKVPEGVLRRIESTPTDFEPDARWAYSNTNYILLGYILERLSGKSYATLLREQIAGPLKLQQTGIAPRVLSPKGRDAASFSASGDGWEVDTLSSAALAAGAGGISATVPDLAVFIEALMQGRLISEASLSKMKEIRGNYGRGLMRIPFYERQAYGHNGRIDNFSSSLLFFPKDSVIVSLVCNAVNYDPNSMLIGVLSLVYGRPYTLPQFAKSVTLTPAQLQRTTGVYSNAQIGMDITIRTNGSSITAQGSGQPAFPLEAISTSSFSNDAAGVVLEFAEGDGPAASMTLLQHGAKLIFTRKN